jgi:hypothetical protein
MDPDASPTSDSPRDEITKDLLGFPTAVMEKYLAHFKDDAEQFITGLVRATELTNKYFTAESLGDAQSSEGLAWSKAYFLYAVNCALISTRLFLSGYLVASGNQARQAVESLAFAVLVPFPTTGMYREFKAGRSIEYKALDWLPRNATHCGANKTSVEALRKQAKFFDIWRALGERI